MGRMYAKAPWGTGTSVSPSSSISQALFIRPIRVDLRLRFQDEKNCRLKAKAADALPVLCCQGEDKNDLLPIKTFEPLGF